MSDFLIGQIFWTITALVAGALATTIAVTWLSLKIGTKTGGWLEMITLSSLAVMTAVSIYIISELQIQNPYTDFQYVYYGLVTWFIFLFVATQRFLIHFFKRRSGNHLYL